MNKYMIRKTLHMLAHHWKIHLSVMLQVAAGIAVIYASLTIYTSIMLQYDDMQSDVRSTIWEINSTSIERTDQPPIDYTQYNMIKDEFPEASFPLYIVHRIYYVTEAEGIQTGYILFASDEFIKSTFNANKTDFENQKKAYIGNDIKAILNSKYQVIKQDIPMSLKSDDQLVIRDVLHVMFSSIEDLGLQDNYFLDEEMKEVPFKNIALIPLEFYYDIFDQKDAESFRLAVKINQEMEGERATSTVLEVINKLFEWNGDSYSFNMKTPLQYFLLKIESVKNSALIAAGIAGLCLIIIFLGLVGLVNILFQRRKQGLAISAALGASKPVLFMELVLEALLPSFMGGILGTVLCSIYFAGYIRFEAFEIHQSVYVMIIAMLLSLLPGLFSALSLVFRIRKLQPLEILRRE